MYTILGEHWRTSLTGFIGAAATALLPVLQGGKFTQREIIIAIVIAVLGRLAADGKEG